MKESCSIAAERAWKTGWERLYAAETSLFYDFVSRYEPDHRFDHLPAPAEIARQFPNSNGWATGMEDSTINGGVMLAAICDRFAATGDRELHAAASKVFRGLELCGTLSAVPGFVLRSVSPLDRTSHYTETSRDQVTHFVHGLWRYFHSGLSKAHERKRISELLQAVCVLMGKRVTVVNGYHIGKENGEPGKVDAMWDVMPHEACRLPMVYAAAWDVTRDSRWQTMYRGYAREAVRQAQTLDTRRYSAAYPLFQHQISLELLAAVADREPDLQAEYHRLMGMVATGSERFLNALSTYQPCSATDLDLNWRHWDVRQSYVDSGYGRVPEWPQGFREREFAPLRQTGEALMIQLMAPGKGLTPAQLETLEALVTRPDYDLTFTYAMLYPAAAFWRQAAAESQSAEHTS